MTKIGQGAFQNCTALEFIEIRGSITEIGNYAFSGCSNVTEIQTKAKLPPTCHWDNGWHSRPFTGINDNCILYYPADNPNYEPENPQSHYRTATVWQDFFTNNKVASYDLQKYSTQVGNAYTQTQAIANKHDVSIYYSLVVGAKFYAIAVRNSITGASQTYTFVVDMTTGEISIQQAPARDKKDNEEPIESYMFATSGLTANTEYEYTITAYDGTEEVMEEFTGTFTTLGETETSFDRISDATTTNKVIKSGQLYILRGDKTYTLTGQEVR